MRSFAERLRQADDSDDSQGRTSDLPLAIWPSSLIRVLPSDATVRSRSRFLPPRIAIAWNRSLIASSRGIWTRCKPRSSIASYYNKPFPLELAQPRGEQLWIGYAGFKIGDPLPISRRQIKQFFEPVLLAGIIKFGLGILAVFIAIVVTSPMIPETFPLRFTASVTEQTDLASVVVLGEVLRRLHLRAGQYHLCHDRPVFHCRPAVRNLESRACWLVFRF